MKTIERRFQQLLLDILMMKNATYYRCGDFSLHVLYRKGELTLSRYALCDTAIGRDYPTRYPACTSARSLEYMYHTQVATLERGCLGRDRPRRTRHARRAARPARRAHADPAVPIPPRAVRARCASAGGFDGQLPSYGEYYRTRGKFVRLAACVHRRVLPQARYRSPDRAS